MRGAVFAALLLTGAAAAPAALIAAQSSPLSTPPPPVGTGLEKGDCLWADDIRNYTYPDRHTILIGAAHQAVYRVTVAGTCLSGVTQDERLTNHGATVGSERYGAGPERLNRICRPVDLDLATSKVGFSGRSRCVVSSIVRMSPAEVAALPRKYVP